MGVLESNNNTSSSPNLFLILFILASSVCCIVTVGFSMYFFILRKYKEQIDKSSPTIHQMESIAPLKNNTVQNVNDAIDEGIICIIDLKRDVSGIRQQNN